MKKQNKLGLVIAAAAVLTVSFASLVSARGWVQVEGTNEWQYVDNDGEPVTDTIQSSGNSKFYLGEDGYMVKDYFLEDKDNATYYFGSNGAMVTNTWVAIESSRVDNQGDYVPDNYWYYFQASGKAMKGTSGSPKKTTIDGKKYLFNEFGQMCTGWVDETGKTINPDDETNPFINAVYYAGGDNDGVLRSGWVTYYDGYADGEDWLNDKTNLYFYFNPSNNKKVGKDNSEGNAEAKTKKINGKTYAFSEEGFMLSSWDVVDDYVGKIDSLKDKAVYFSDEDDGHQVKKGWVYAVPAKKIDEDAYDDGEEKYMYFNASGDAVFDQIKKINGKYYAFSGKGIMKTGLVIWNPDNTGKDTIFATSSQPHYVNTIDTDWASGEDVVKRGLWQADSNEWYAVDPDGRIVHHERNLTAEQHTNITLFPGSANEAYKGTYKNAKENSFGGADLDYDTTSNGVDQYHQYKIHYFGADGARKTGNNNVEFTDDNYTLYTTAAGDKGSGVFSKKYYQFGFLLKASNDLKFGIYVATPGEQLKAQNDKYETSLASEKYIVLSTSGSKVKGANTAKKDADGNYWFIEKSTDTLKGIWTVNIKDSAVTNFKLKYYTLSSITDVDVLKTQQLVNGNGTNIDSKWANDEWDKHSGNFTVSSEAVNGTTPQLYVSYLTTKEGFSAYQYQSDYNGSSNKWIPFGIVDDAKKSPVWACTLESTYAVKPSTDYFVNAYWNPSTATN